jgi:penicillin-binding protein 1B
MSRSNQIVLIAVFAFAALAAGGFYVVRTLQEKIDTRMEKGWVLPPLELYSQGIPLAPGRHFPLQQVEDQLGKRGLRAGRDYHLESVEACAELTELSFSDGAERCLWLREPALVVTWDADGWILDLFKGKPLAPALGHGLFPQLITQFYEGAPILQQNTPLGEIPLYCRLAAMAIEDRNFLEHKGFSFTGFLRAVFRNLKKGWGSEGGSTITQQLVKNFFLDSKKTIKRKAEEAVLAVLMETRPVEEGGRDNKDLILEMYLNVIYMGQSGPYQVRGFGSAARYNFDKPISQLSLAECALLAATINSPGRYSPFEHPEAAKARRELVLKKMAEASMISESEATAAAAEPLPKLPPNQKRTHAPYFVMSALREFESWEIDAEDGARLFTTLDPETQGGMVSAVTKVMPGVEARVKKPSAQPLQVAAIAIDVNTAEVLALTGGRDYRSTQFNRAMDSRRQIGSVVKPFVYWPALKENNPLTTIDDANFEWKNGKTVWKPKNYEGKSYGNVPFFFALAHSLNVPAARVGQMVGLGSVIETMRRAGVTSPLPELPALTLGIAELSPFEVAQAYLSLARLGSSERIHLLSRAEDLSGRVLFEYQPSGDRALEPEPTAVLVGMMKQGIEIGTGKVARLMGVPGALAGKTGTTSDTKDAWFAGFSPRVLVVVWVGYDDNTPTGLTGAGAALPVWSEIMKLAIQPYKPTDFTWPSGVESKSIPREDLMRDYPVLPELPESIELIFQDWAS